MARQLCTKENPMPLSLVNEGQWSHPNATEQDMDSDYYIYYHCPNCGLDFKVEMPD